MQKSESNQMATIARRKVKSSTTLNRKYVKKPAKSSEVAVSIKRSPKIKRFSSDVVETSPKKRQDVVSQFMQNQATHPSMGQQIVEQMTIEQPEQIQARQKESVQQPEQKAELHPLQATAYSRMKQRTSKQPEEKKLTAKELKDQAIKKALASASQQTNDQTETKKIRTTTFGGGGGLHFGLGRVLLALSCAAVAVLAIVYFVDLSMPDLSLRVAAMQTGIDASYPSFVPRDYSLSDITSESGKITLNFKNDTTNDTFSLVEEQSSWDSSALLTNYVKDEYGEDYTVVREQGLTLYIGNNETAWVNGGIFYKLGSTGLTKKQIRSIAVSL